MAFTPRTDLQTKLTDATNGIDASNLTNYSTRPKVIIDGNHASDSGGDYQTGTINLISELYRREQLANRFRNERYTVAATYTLVDQDDDTNAKDVLTEVDRVLRAYNDTLSRDYHYSLDYDIFDFASQIICQLTFTLIKEYVEE